MAGEWIVSQLIDSDTSGWNHHLVESLFLPFEAQRIMGIPLCMSRQEDCIIWPRCNSGVYLVKTSYVSWKIVRGPRLLMWKHPEFFGGVFGNLSSK